MGGRFDLFPVSALPLVVALSPCTSAGNRVGNHSNAKTKRLTKKFYTSILYTHRVINNFMVFLNKPYQRNHKLFDIVLREKFPNLAKEQCIAYPLGGCLIVNIE